MYISDKSTIFAARTFLSIHTDCIFDLICLVVCPSPLRSVEGFSFTFSFLNVKSAKKCVFFSGKICTYRKKVVPLHCQKKKETLKKLHL